MEKNWSMVMFDFFENLFGLAGEIGLTILSRAYRYIKFVLKWSGIGLALSAVVGAIGAYFDRGGAVFAGIAGVGVSIAFAFLALSPAVYLLWTAGEKDRKLGRIAQTAFVLMTGMLVLGVYVAVFHAWQSPEFWILLVAVGILIMATVMAGSSISPEAIGGWAKRVSIIVVVLMAVSFGIKQLPDFYRAKFTDSAKMTIGLDSDEVAFENIDKFFSGDGKPVIWYTENSGNRKFYKAPGFDKRTGDSRIAITKQIVGEEDSRRVFEKQVTEQKLVDEKQAADEQKAVADIEVARLKAEQENQLKAQQVTKELEVQQQERETLAEQQRVEAERVAQEAAQEEQRQLALRPILVASTIMGPSDQSQDIVVTRPSTQFTYQKTSFEPEQSVVTFDIIGVKPTASDKNKYDVTLQPETLISNGQKYDISRRAEPVQLTVKKDNSNSIRNIIGGTLAGVAVGAIMGGKKGAVTGAVIGATAGTIYTVASHGQKFQLVAGDPMPPILIRPIVP